MRTETDVHVANLVNIETRVPNQLCLAGIRAWCVPDYSYLATMI
jgi:hypothetical protein